MPQDPTIQQELQELQSSLAQQLSQPYQVAPGYFDGLAGQILLRIRAMEAKTTDVQSELDELSPLLGQLKRQAPYTVPSGYFESLEASLPFDMDQSAAEELETLSPLLSGLKKQVPYTIPEGYFEQLSPGLEQPKLQPAAKVVSIRQPKWFRYAAAAVVTGLVATSAVLFFNRPAKVDPATSSYAWIEKNMKKVSTEDINGFVELAKEEPVISAVAPAPAIKSLLSDVSDKEIQDFLNDTGSGEPDSDDDLFLN